MGNAFSSSNALVIQTNQPYYFGGDTVEGVVALNCVNSINTSGIVLEVRWPASAHPPELRLLPESQAFLSPLQILGREVTHYSTNDGSSSSSSSGTRSHHGENDFLKANIPLGPPGTLAPGQYQFGFKFALPATVPPSFSYRKGGDSAEIQYKVKAHVSKSGFDIKGEALFQVYARPPPQSPPAFMYCQNNVTMCCCCSQGQATVAVSLDKSVLLCGETVTVTAQARNNTRKHMDAVYVNFKHRVSMRAYPGTSTPHSYTETIVKIPTEGLAPGQAAEGATSRRVQLQVPPALLPTSGGVLVQSAYCVEVEMKGGMGVSATRVQVPVAVAFAVPSGPPPRGDGAMEGHPEWKPTQVFPSVEVSVPGEGQSTLSSAPQQQGSQNYPPPMYNAPPAAAV